MIRTSSRSAVLTSLVALTLAGCYKFPSETPAAPVEVSVATVATSTVTLVDDLPGRVVALRTAEIRPQVGGIVQKVLFTQGAEVRAGQPLFQINAAPFQADAGSAQAALERATAAFKRAEAQADRLRPLVDADAISRQAYDDAVSARNQAAADVAEARANLQRRRLDLGFATVTAPISGRIGEARVTEGALVNAGDAAAMASVQQIDQVYVDVRQPSARLDALRQAAGAAAGPVEIVSSSGISYAAKGRLLFSDITVDPATGDAVARVVTSNPGKALLPGMFVRARLPRTTIANALLVPQQAVQRNGAGAPVVNVVDSKGAVSVRSISVADVVNGNYVVTGGLRVGERVVVEGNDRLQPGAKVKTVPYQPQVG